MVNVTQIITLIIAIGAIAAEVWILNHFMNAVGIAFFVGFTLLIVVASVALASRMGSTTGGTANVGRNQRSKGARSEED